MGQRWPAAGLGPEMCAEMHAWDLLNEVTIIFITSTIVQFSSVQSLSHVRLFVTA